MRTKNYKCFFVLYLLLIIGSIKAQNCGNVGVDDGTFNYWKGFTGVCKSGVTGSGQLPSLNLRTNPIQFTTSKNYLDSVGNFPSSVSRMEIMTPKGGVGGYDSIIPFIPVVSPYGGNHSIRIGNWKTNSHSESLQFEYDVDSANANLNFQYAVILQDPSHNIEHSPAFRIHILDSNGTAINPTCGIFEIYGGQSGVGFQTYTGAGLTPISYINWTLGSLNLLAYVDQKIIINISTNDCSLGGHYGYAYVDFSCASLNLATLHCKGNSISKVVAPTGYSSYSWVANSQIKYPPLTGTTFPSGAIITTNDTLSFLTSDTTTIYTCNVISFTNMLCPTKIGYTFNNKLATNNLTSLSANAGVKGTKYQWYNCKTDSIIPGETNLYFSPKVSGSYAVIIKNNSCVDTSVCQSYYKGNPALCLKPTLNSTTSADFCKGDSINLVSSISSIKWNYKKITSQSLFVKRSGTFYVTNTDSNCVGLPISAISSNKIQANSIEIAKPKLIVSKTTICDKQPVNVSIEKQANYQNYSWCNLAKNLKDNTADADTIGDYYVTVSDINGCKNTSDSIFLISATTPNPSIKTSNQNVCFPSTISIKVLNEVGNYKWMLNGLIVDSLSKNDSILIDKSGTYKVIVSDSGCVGSSPEVTLKVNNKPKATISYIQDTLCSGNVSFSSALSKDVKSFLWHFNDNSSGIDFKNVNHTFRKSGIFLVKLTVGNECGYDSTTVSVNVCSTVDVEKLISNENISVYPNPFKDVLILNTESITDSYLNIEITSVTGQLDYSEYMVDNHNGHILDLKNMNSGIYFVRLFTESKNYNFKIIKQ